MSLQVWLPLNGNTQNQGLNESIFTTVGSGITYTNGKIGQAATFPNNFASYIYTSGLQLQVFSWTCWLKCTGEGAAAYQFLLSEGRDTGSMGVNIRLTKAGTGLYCDAHKVRSNTFAIELNKWYHFAMVADGTNMKYYLNGELKQTQAYTEDSDYAQSNNVFVLGKMAYSYTNTGAYFCFNGQLNDVRIYDHALSAKEVEEISKGLVLHYKLDNGGGKNNNIKNSTIVNRGCTSLTYDKSTAEWTAVCPVNSSTWGVGFYINDSSIKWAYGETWVISLEVYTPQVITWQCDINNKPDLTDISSYTGNDYDITGQRKVNTNGINNSKTLQPGWNKIWFSQTASGSTYGLSNYTTNWGIVTSSLTDPITIKLRNIKGEVFQEGEIISSTPFIPNNTDLFQDSIIYDSSGYQHNGDLVGTITFPISTPRYNISTHFINGSYGRIKERPSVCLPTDAITVNLWVRIDTWGNPISCTEGGGWNFENSSGIQFPVYVASVGYKVANSGVTPTTLGNTWHMLTGTFDKENVKIYIDSVLKKTTATGSTNPIGYANNYLFLAAEASGNNTSPANSTFVGDLSDLRIYCTALTEDQIKELYDTSATIDKSGNIYAREVIED